MRIDCVIQFVRAGEGAHKCSGTVQSSAVSPRCHKYHVLRMPYLYCAVHFDFSSGLEPRQRKNAILSFAQMDECHSGSITAYPYMDVRDAITKGPWGA